MDTRSATAIAHPNIAFIKYWGNRDDALRLPSNGSISMNLDGLETQTHVEFDPSLSFDELWINGEKANRIALERVSRMLNQVRALAVTKLFARIESKNNFPIGSGIASSASAFAALAMAASSAVNLDLSETDISRLARKGSGSACRSIPGGFVEWFAGTSDEDSYAKSFAAPDHWNLVDCIAIISTDPKTTSSSQGNEMAGSSPLQAARVADAPRRLTICRKAIMERDMKSFASIVEEDSNLMHAVMMTSQPALFYWLPETLGVMRAIREARKQGLEACYTIDAGPNVHVLCEQISIEETTRFVRGLPGVQEVRVAEVGGPARVVKEALKKVDNV